MIKIFTDSTADLSKELLERYNITVVPLHICLFDKEYRDGLEITPEEIYKWADENNTTPKTSAISPEDCEKLFKPVIDAGDEIIVFSISSQMSTTNNVMKLVAANLNSEDKISVIDSENLSTGIGLLVIEAAVLASRGESRADIVRRIEELRPMVRASFVVDTLVYLHRGGRCSSVAAMMGSMLKLHPRIVVKDGAMLADKKYRGKISTVIMDYAKDLEPLMLNSYKDRVFITHSGASDEDVAKVKAYLESLDYFKEIYITRAGSVVSSHCGPGTLGVLFIAKG
ncbi:MAG: DegV family protein [Lachnospiraceae bacterium]|nr:DegV family protein [Lachnospiraceae bacterium]MBQ9579680.1 DegV family protein [Lachnospiraceae bacterium]